MFIDRQPELAALDKAYYSDVSSFVVVYGRRRVGKTALIRHFLQCKKAVYFLATQESESINRSVFQGQLAAELKLPYLKDASNLSWELMFKEIAAASETERMVIVIDEFQYIGLSNPAFPSLFQKIWDNILKNSNVMVIICGSLISLMEKQVLNYSSPLYGRRTAQIKVRPILYSHYQDFYPPGYSQQDLLWRYGITGGIPRYIELLGQPGPEADLAHFWQLVERELLSRNAPLYEEPYFLLNHEIKELGNYFSVLKAIAAGNHKLGHIARSLEVKESKLRHYLNTLINLDIIERIVPVTEEQPEKSKQSLYRIRDEFIRFWFNFVFPNRSILEMDRTGEVLEQVRKRYVQAHLSYTYETVCFEDLTMRSDREYQSCNFNRFGKWWDRQQEIDLVALSDQTKSILFGECKLSGKPLDTDLYYNLRLKAEQVPWQKGIRDERYVLYSFFGYTDQLCQLAESEPRLRLLS